MLEHLPAPLRRQAPRMTPYGLIGGPEDLASAFAASCAGEAMDQRQAPIRERLLLKHAPPSIRTN
jgi:hypothetical protein